MSAIGNRKSAMILVRLFRVVRSCFNPAGQFSLAFLFLISLLAGIDRRRYGAGLTRRGVTSCLRYFTNFSAACEYRSEALSAACV